MREYGLRREIRLNESDTERVERLAARSGRSVSEFLRCVIRAIDPEQVSTGIPLPTFAEAEAAERELSAA